VISYKFKLHSKAKEEGFLGDKITKHLLLYNRLVDLGNRFYKRYKKILRSKTIHKYLQMKKHDPSWDYILKGLNAWAVQQTVRRRDEAFDRFFKYLKKKKKNSNVKPKESPPDKHRVHGEGSFKLAKGCGWRLVDGGVQVGRLWNNFGVPKDVHTYRFFGNREILGTIKNAVFKRDRCGDFWCIITTDHTSYRYLAPTGRIGGFDYSQEHFFVSDDGRTWDIPKVLLEHFDELSKVNHKMHKAKDGSGNRKRLVAKRARLYRKITNIRKELHYALAWKMCREYDVLCFEHNNYEEMYDPKRVVDGHRVSKKQRIRLRALAPASFITILKEVAKKAGRNLFFADQHFASSQICSNCGHVNKAVKKLRVRKWTCLKCGTKHDRDINAAKNLVKEFERTAGGASSVATQEGTETAKETYWNRIRKSALVKRAAGAGEKSPCPQIHQVADADKADETVEKCPELYTDAVTVQIKKEEEKKHDCGQKIGLKPPD